MSWNTLIKPEKGILAGEVFLSGDMTGNITFSNYIDSVNIIPTVSQDEQNHRIQEYVGWTYRGNSFNWIVTNLDTTHKLVAAFRLTAVDQLNPNAGTFLCLKMWARNIQNTESRQSAYIGCEWSKRVYTDATHYTESYPLGNYWPDTEYNFTPSTEFPNRSAQTLALFLKTGFFNLEKNVVGGMAIGWRNGYASCYASGMGWRAKYSWFKSANGFGTDADFPDGEDESPEFGPAGKPMGGYIPGGGTIPGKDVTKIPSFDNSSDKITISTKPTHSALSSCFFHAYVVTDTSMQYIADALFPQPVFSQPDLIDAMGELAQIMFFNKQIDYMLDALILPIAVPHGDWEHIKVGGRELKTVVSGTETWINGQPVTNAYVDFSCGSLSIDEYWVNFLDFAGTKVKLFLPYVGYVDIQPEYVIGGTLYVDYRFNVVDGSFMCYVRSHSGYSQLDESLIGQYAGVAAQHIPLQSQDYSNKISGLISAIGSVAAGAASGGVSAAVGVGAAANAGNTLVQKPGSSHANGYNASSSFLSHRTPYIIIERQWSQFSEKYPEEIGLPANSMQRIGDLYGLVKSQNAHLDTIPCSAEGKETIARLLSEGIIV